MSETASRALSEGLPKGPDAEIAPLDDSAHDWRRLFQHQLNVSIVVISGLITLVGSLVLGIDLTVLHGESKTVVLEVAVSLILFGTTTLFITVAVAASLETRMEASIKQILKGERREIGNLAATVRNMLESERGEILKLNKATQDAVRETQADLRPLGGNWRALGLTNVYLTRSDALAEFGEQIRTELLSAEAAQAEDAEPAAKDRVIPDGRADTESGQAETERPRLWIAASSMKGLLEAAGKEFDGLGIFNWAANLAASRKLDLRIMMTHPDFAMLRAGQEDRGENAIPEEIREAVNHLRRENVPPELVKMVAATPTVFAIATRDQMLLNPYPYSQEAYRSFTLTVRRSKTKREVESIDRDIFEQYERRHFLLPWESDRALRLGDLYEIPLRPDNATPPPRSADVLLRSVSGAK
jgi:hypothetical protein